MSRWAVPSGARCASSRRWQRTAPVLQFCLLASLLWHAGAQSSGSAPSSAGAAANASSPPASGSDRAVLLTFINEVDNWSAFAKDNNLTGWTSGGGSACRWEGVECSNSGQVTSIDLPCNACETQLQGPLPDALAQLPALQILSFAGNSLRGTLPVAWSASGAFPKLTLLDLADNNLNGALPPQWAGIDTLPQLARLNLSNNAFAGSVPDTWLSPRTFPELTMLDLTDNNLSGSLDVSWADPLVLPKLSILSLAGNNVTETLPDVWADAQSFANLTELDLSRNSLVGTLPAAWGASFAFPKLTALSLYENSLDGLLPLEWGQDGSMANLQTLYLDRNFLSGSLPPQWGVNATSWPRLRTLGLSSCGLTGPLPQGWGSNGSFPELRDLFLSYNKLSGTVPSTWDSFQSLQKLWLRPANYQLCGDLPANLNFTVCANNGTCVPTSLICQAEQPDASVVELIMTILGYALNPFTTTQEEGLKLALVDELPELQSPDNITILYVQQSDEPISSGLPAAPASGVITSNSSDGSAAFPHGLSDSGTPPSVQQQSASAGGRRLVEHREPGGRRGLVARWRRRLRQSQVPASEVFSAAGSPLQSVTVTMNLQTNDSGQAALLGSSLPYQVSYNQDLVQQLQANGINATETQWIYNSGAPVTSGAQGPGSPGVPGFRGPGGSEVPGDQGSGGGNNSRTIEMVIGIVSGTVVAALLGVLVAVFLLWRRARHRAEASAALSAPPNGTRWSKMASVFSNGSNRSVGSGPESGSAGSSSPGTGRGLVFPPLNIGETGIDIDMDNLFRSAGAASDPGSVSGEGGGPVELPRVPFSDWELRPEDIAICTRPDGRQWEIGSGAFGQVYKAMLGGVQTVAVKMLAGQQDPAAQAKFCREVAILRSCRNSNIVQFQGACVSGGATMLVTEYMDAGDLWRILSRDTDRSVFGWYKRGKQVALDVAGGLHWLHSHRIVHFDLKSQNILLARDGTAKIADVGLARILNRDYVTSLDMAGTFAWAAPELLLGSRCTEKVDIYSFGIVLWELVTGERPLRGQTRELRVPEECPKEVDALIAACMAADPGARPSAKEIHETLVAIQYAPNLPRVTSLPKATTMLSGMNGPMSASMGASSGSALSTGGSQPAAAVRQQPPRTPPGELSPVSSMDGSSLQASSPLPRDPLPHSLVGGSDGVNGADTPHASAGTSAHGDSASPSDASNAPNSVGDGAVATAGLAPVQSWQQQGLNPFGAPGQQSGAASAPAAEQLRGTAAEAAAAEEPQQGDGWAGGRFASPFASPLEGGQS